MRRRWIAVGFVGLLACSDERARAEREARTRAEQAQREAAARTADAARVAREAQAYAEAKARAAAAAVDTDAAARAIALGQRAKAELDKVYRTDSDYDLDVTAAGASADHAAKLAALPHVTVGDLTVGYEQVTTISTAGVGRSRHFRATWRRGDRDVIVGYQTSEAIDVVAFAKLLDKLVPSVERALE
ncbi:MAG: hypothetical protein JNK64_01225 [Myxococcales bacterium]|nr:hypothetical protein [Myxococcales bacterium]